MTTRPTYPMYQLALACLLLAGWAAPSRAAAVYTVTDLGSDRGLGYVFDASGAATPRTDIDFVRQRDGRYAIDSYPDPTGVDHSYLSVDGGRPVELGSPLAGGVPQPDGTLPHNANTVEIASAVNASGTVVGSYEPLNPIPRGSFGTAFVYYGPQTGLHAVPLPTLTEPYYGFVASVANSINDSGLIVGSVVNYYAHDGLGSHAFLSDGHSSWDLNTLLAPGSGVGLTDAFDINAAGQIIAQGRDASGQTHDYLLTPAAVPEPSSLALLAAGCLLGAGRLAARRRG